MSAALAAHAFVVECDLFIATAEEYYFLYFFWQIFKCSVETESIMFRQVGQQVVVNPIGEELRVLGTAAAIGKR